MTFVTRAQLDALDDDALVAAITAGPVALLPFERLDLRGEVCPFTFVRTKLKLEEMPAGARLLVEVDHAPALKNVPRSVTEWGQGVISVGATTIIIEKRT
jgi:tRNA 2-thiouridine synthesizing protein A